MALTVADCMKIGALRQAETVAGRDGLHRVVEGVTMLEFNGFDVEGLGVVALKGHELVISSLSAFTGRPIKFVTLIERIKAHSFSCLVVFYVGHIMKEIPPEALRLFDREKIPLIVMPNDFNYAYVDVVMPIAEAIVNDKHSGRMFVSDTLQQLICLDDEHQNLHTLLEMLYVRIRSDLLLLDTSFQPLDWVVKENAYSPIELIEYGKSALKGVLPHNPAILTYAKGDISIELRFQPIRTNKMIGALLAVNYSEDDFDIDALTQAAEVIKLFMRVWRLTRGGLCELDALLQGGSAGQKERRIRALTVIRNEGGTSLDLIQEELAMVNMLKNDINFMTNDRQEVTYFSGSIVIASLTEHQDDTESLLRKLESRLHLTKPLCSAKCSMAFEKGKVQQVYSIMFHALPVATRVFHHNRFFEEKEITFAYDVYKLLLQPQIAESLMEILSPLMADDRWKRHRETLESFFLDCNANFAASATSLGIHVNTLKYRMRTMSDILRQDIVSSLCSSRIILALALLRAR
jgi:hypothetical protein